MSSARARARRVHERLIQFYGTPEWRAPLPPLDELISTILSQNTNDGNRDRAFARLRERWPTWEGVREARLAEIVEAIRPAGLARQKAPRIQEILHRVNAECGALNLDCLRHRSREEAETWLRKLPGVGPKTASIVLLFSLGFPAFPVDTHVYRVTGRLGLRPARQSVTDAHRYLAGLFSPSDYAAAHLNLIRLGRGICQARRPKCPVCPLRRSCPVGSASGRSVRRP
jgi:endonuclease-3